MNCIYGSRRVSIIILLTVFICILGYFAYFQFMAPTLYGFDGYFHTAAARFLRQFGPHYDFHWARFTTFSKYFSDKDFLLHVIVACFQVFVPDEILASKFSIIFLNLAFLLSYLFVLRKYLPDYLAALFLLLPAVSSTFSIYFLYLRPAIISHIFTIFIVYFLIHKKWAEAGFIALAYPLAHISFVIIIPFVFACEVIRYKLYREFFVKNVYAVLLGVCLGCIIHPNFPHNFISIYLNAFLVPLYSATGVNLDFGRELFSTPLDKAFIANFFVFFSMNVVIVLSFVRRVKLSFATLTWWACAFMYALLTIFSNRHWYSLNVLFFIFFASYINDWRRRRDWLSLRRGINYVVLCSFGVIMLLIGPNRELFLKDVRQYIYASTHYENVARWMAKNIPEGEVVYHAYWSDSPFFICFNPKNDYVMLLDPIYTFWPYPYQYHFYRRLKDGRTIAPHKVLVKVFGARYGYAHVNSWLYNTVRVDKEHFDILYSDERGLVFKVIGEPRQDVDPVYS